MSNIDLPKEFQERLTAQVKELVFNSLPDETIQELIKREFNAFFEAPHEAFTIHHETGSYSSSYQRLTTSCSPFRLMVWRVLNEFLHPRLKSIVDDSNSELRKSMDQWLEEIAKPELSGDYKAFVHQLSVANSQAALAVVAKASAENVKMSMSASIDHLRTGGYGSPPEFAVIIPSLGITV